MRRNVRYLHRSFLQQPFRIVQQSSLSEWTRDRDIAAAPLAQSPKSAVAGTDGFNE